MGDPFLFTSSTLPDDTRVIGFKGIEVLGQPFEYEIYVTTDSPDDIDLEDATLGTASLSIAGQEADPMYVTGILRRLEIVHESRTGAVLRLELVPRFWLLSQSVHSRVFTDKSFRDVADEVFDLAGLKSDEVGFDLKGSYDPEEHITQYGESDLAFVTRWFEREGMYYYFECDDRAGKAVIVDTNPQKKLWSRPIPSAMVFGRNRDVLAGASFDKARFVRSAQTSSIKLKDYDYLKPQLVVDGEATVFDRSPVHSSEFGRRFFTPKTGKRLATVRAESLLAQQDLLYAEGRLAHVRPGYQFDLDGHPRGDLNQAYLAIRTEIAGLQLRGEYGTVVAEILGIDEAETLRTKVVALPASVPYRAPTTTAWPRIHAQEIAVVDGEADGEYAQLDAEGRYKIHFLFDENDNDDGKASTWVRMMQPHAGNPEGFHFPLRKGTEVIVTFIAGDPDRPLICGSVPNAENPSPVTSANATRNILITGGRNKLEIEDQDGQQWINWFTPSKKTEIHMGYQKGFGVADAHLGQHTDGTAVFTFGADWWTDVGGLHDEHVKGTVTQKYDSTKDETVKGAVHEIYQAGQKTEVSGGNRELQVTGDLIEHCTGTANQDYDTAHNINTGPRVDHVKGTLEETADGTHQLTTGARTDHVKGTFQQTADGAHTLTTGARTDTINGTLSQSATGAITVTAPSITHTSTGPTSLFTNASKMAFTYGLSLTGDLSASLSLFAGAKVSAELAIKISATAGLKADFGSAVSMRAAPLQVTLGAAMTTISASGCVDIVTPCLMVPAASIVLL